MNSQEPQWCFESWAIHNSSSFTDLKLAIDNKPVFLTGLRHPWLPRSQKSVVGFEHFLAAAQVICSQMAKNANHHNGPTNL